MTADTTRTYTGRCACAAVAATISGGPTNNAIFLTANIEMTGELRSHSGPAASGNTLTQYFCPKCGAPVYGQSSARPHIRSIRLGFLDEPHDLRPTAAIWLDDASDWAMIDPALGRFNRQPPAPTNPS